MPPNYVTKSLSNIPIYKLISEPLKAACEAQRDLATTLANFIVDVGMEDDGNGDLKYVEFSYTMPNINGSGEADGNSTYTYKVPLLAIINVPALKIDTVDINFEMTVTQSSETTTEVSVSAQYKAWYSPVSVSFKGSLSNTSKRAATAVYNVQVRARDDPPEGLSTMLEALTNTASTVQSGTS